ncbi:MAG: alpha-glucosidase C-terminal domain-containing protein, partial [Bacteroidota bacterium]|nr:alpha-glucosidase C-terminal domain-containing protein [Bacteroidota bacterium]
GGIPLIYAGDEIGTLNDYSFQNDVSKKGDSRWVNRPLQDWETISSLDNQDSPQSKIFHALKKLIKLRKGNTIFADHNNLELCYTGNDHILSFERVQDQKGLLVICNFDENAQVIDSSWIKKLGYFSKGEPMDLVSGEKVELNSALLEIMPYQMLWLMKS